MARDHGIAGLEFLRSIPGTVGGFVRMNGGAYGGEVKDILVDCDVVLRSGELVTLSGRGLALQLSPFRIARGAIVVAARFGGTRRPRGNSGRNGPHLRQHAKHRSRCVPKPAARPLKTPMAIRLGSLSMKPDVADFKSAARKFRKNIPIS